MWAVGFVSAALVLGAEAQRGWAGSLGADGSRLEGPFAFCYSKAAVRFTKSPLVKMETDGELLAL